jgi:hypothetical protein
MELCDLYPENGLPPLEFGNFFFQKPNLLANDENLLPIPDMDKGAGHPSGYKENHTEQKPQLTGTEEPNGG